LGGYPVSGGSFTAYGRFIRSDAPTTLTEGDIRLLEENRITTVVDLRTEAEAEAMPCACRGLPTVHYYNISMFGGAILPASVEEIPSYYLGMVKDHHTIAEIMHLMAASPAGVLYHCAAGKDRTGVLTALLLSLAGVSEADIQTDYQASLPLVLPLLKRIQAEDPNFPMQVSIPRPENMKVFLEMFYKKYNSTITYLSNIGMTEEEISLLKKKMICHK